MKKEVLLDESKMFEYGERNGEEVEGSDDSAMGYW